MTVERVERLGDEELEQLCEATERAIVDGGGFGWLEPPGREALRDWWRGFLADESRDVLVARADGRIAGSVQLLRSAPHAESTRFRADVVILFVDPRARGGGLGRALLEAAEARARELGLGQLNLDVRETQAQEPARSLYESLGYRVWGRKERYACVGGEDVAGLYLVKELGPE